MASSILAKLAVLISGDASGLNKSISQSTKNLNGFQKASSAALKTLGGALAAVSFAAIGREIIAITSQFQKFEAVLTNTLGSNSEAQKALEQIRDFAAKTPFSVEELTSSFVKLANQGFQPTRDEMRKLGDLASSTGKSFDQLTEAIIDAQTGEFERLKEFGIRASKAGDQVKFTFKGVQTQTEFTADSIQKYILGLGDLQGVSGSMAAISATLGGSISNLGDSFDNLLLTVGNLTSGPLKGFVDLLQRSIEVLAQDISGDTGATSRLQTVNELYVEGKNSVEDITASLAKLQRLRAQEQNNLTTATDKLGGFKDQLSLSTEEYTKLVKETGDATEFTQAYDAAITALTLKLGKLNEATSNTALALIPALNAEIKRFEGLKNKSFDVEAIGRFNVKIQELKDELDVLNATGSESGFLKNLNKGITTPEVAPTATPESPFATELTIDVRPYQEALANAAQSQDAFGKLQGESFDQMRARWDAQIAKQQEAAAAAASYGEVVGQALGDAISGQITFAQAAKRITADLIKMFLQRALAGIIASAATSGGPPPVAIALAAAGVAAISAMFNKLGASGGGSVGAASIGNQASKNSDRLSRSSATDAQDVKVTGQAVIKGQDLLVLFKNVNDNNQFLRAQNG